ncbi:YlxR family protein [Nocardioides sp. ChNu-153]|uniref:YlxR family protein n=1 Tax=unclassified Nocardioides TaxID=2615069 RepID=UPI002404F0E1|nr:MULTISPECIES: YlxR family protein [unclassified Nocardioides]MDF9717764.1 YlxR family protein [Nocardioides sp. ChNu-99]MDN7122584.1 YlxR family protein [Nocardioides sp. ChNu-153]
MARARKSAAGPDTPTTSLAEEGPVRTCVGCRARATKNELLRVTVRLGTDGREVVAPDPTSSAPGRGAHLHPTRECFDTAVRRKAFSRALRRGGALPADAVAEHLDSLAARSTTT